MDLEWSESFLVVVFASLQSWYWEWFIFHQFLGASLIPPKTYMKLGSVVVNPQKTKHAPENTNKNWSLRLQFHPDLILNISKTMKIWINLAQISSTAPVPEVWTAALNFQEARNMATVPPTIDDLAAWHIIGTGFSQKICWSHVNLAWFSSSCGEICQIGTESQKLPSFQPHSGSWEWNQHLSQTSPMQSQPFWVKKRKIQLPSAAPSGCATECHITVHGSHWSSFLATGCWSLFFAPGLYQSSALAKYWILPKY